MGRSFAEKGRSGVPPSGFTFADALTFVRLWYAREQPSDQVEILELCERIVLGHAPQSFDEAASMIEVLRAGGLDRSDGFDLIALTVLHAFLRGAALTEPDVAAIGEPRGTA